MSKQRHFKAQGLVKEYLAGGVVYMIIPPDDMGDAHLGVIHHNGEIVGRITVRPFDNQVIKFIVVEGYRSLHQVPDHGCTVIGATEADN